MATFVINQRFLGTLLNSTVGPVGREVGRLADAVATAAHQNATGPVIGIDSGRLIAGIRTQLSSTPLGVQATVSTNAKKVSRSYPQGFAYPAFHDVSYPPGTGGGAGEPHGGQHQWLTRALREVFPG